MMTAQTHTKTSVASVEDVRAHFPALERVHNGYAVAYFDGPGGTQVPRAVGEAMTNYLYHHNANTHWAYPTSQETDAAIENARAACADFINASPAEIVFGANMTTLTFHLARALSNSWAAGDEIVTTELDHHANIDPWRRLTAEKEITVRVARLDIQTGQIDWNHLESCINGRTRLLAIGAASNALGTINDIPRAIELARRVNAKVFVDGVHYVPHQLADVRAWDCDFLGMSAYKFYGPHIGILYCKRQLIEEIDFPKLVPSPEAGPERAETGTLNQEGIVGAGAAVDFLASLASDPSAARGERLRIVFDELHRRSAILTRKLWNALSAMNHVQLYGPSADMARTATVSFVVKNIASTDVARRLATRGLFLSHGDFYAATVIDRLGLAPEGLVRAGCACYTTKEEVERLIEAVRELTP